ncbi:MAG TPA: hypothetical protein VM282_23395 [Acidimicrobiales bacterium]|nr:hypothetical protein [Acidimicrobiales bacterium]
MNVRVKARRPIGLVVVAAAIAFFFAAASPASAQDNVENNNDDGRDMYSASVHGTCEGGFAVTIENDSNHDVDVLIRLNGVDTVVEVQEDSSLTIQPLTLNEDIPNTILVKVGEEILLQKTFSVNCLPDPESKLSASISSDCEGSSVTITNDGDADGTATVTVNGSSVDHNVAAGKTVTMTVVLNEDADNTIAVTAGDTNLAHKTIYVDCEQELPPTTTLAPPTTTTPADPEPVVEVLGQTVEHPQTLAFTGRNTVFEAMIGVLLLGLGLQLMRSSRRLDQTS